MNLDWIQMISAKLTNFKWCGLHCRYFGNTPVYKCFNVDLGTWMSICAITYRSSSNKAWIYRYTNNIIGLRMVKSSRKGIFLGDGRNTKQIWIEFRRKALSYLQKREDGEKKERKNFKLGLDLISQIRGSVLMNALMLYCFALML